MTTPQTRPIASNITGSFALVLLLLAQLLWITHPYAHLEADDSDEVCGICLLVKSLEHLAIVSTLLYICIYSYQRILSQQIHAIVPWRFYSAFARGPPL